MVSPEEFCDNVKLVMQQNIQAALDAQTARWAVADAAAGRKIELIAPRPEEYYIGGAATAIRYPAVEIAVPDLSVSAFSLENFDGDAFPKLMVRVIFEEARSVEELYRMGCRWFAAVVSVVAAPGAFGEVDIDTSRGLSGSWRFNPETGTVDQIQSGVLCTFNLAGPLSPFAA